MAKPFQVVVLVTATTTIAIAIRSLADVRRAQTSGLASNSKEVELTGKPDKGRRLWANWRFAMVSKDEGFPTAY